MKRTDFTNRMNFFRFQHGASLLEALAFLGIAAIVILGAISLLGGAFNSAQTNRASEEILAIQTNIKKLYMGQAANYGAITTANLILAKVFPSTLTPNAGSTALTNAWGGTVTVAPTGTSGSTFTITYTAVPQDVCINMISGASGWTEIDQGTSTGAGGSAEINIAGGQTATPAAASTLCSVAGANTISFTSL